MNSDPERHELPTASRRTFLGGATAVAGLGALMALAGAESAAAAVAFNFPLENYVTPSSHFGMRNGKMHEGVDLPGRGLSIRSIASGTVTYVGFNHGGWGNFAVVQHEDGWKSHYAHAANGSMAVSVGESVSAGKHLAITGDTASPGAYHLHLELRKNEVLVDPWPYIKDAQLPDELPTPSKYEENEMRPVNIWNANPATVSFRGATIGYTTVEVQRYPTVLKAKARAERFFSYALEVTQEEFDGYIADVNERRAQMNLAPIVWPNS